MRWTCLECGKQYDGRFSDPCPECRSGRAIIDPTRNPVGKPMDPPASVVTVTPPIATMAPATRSAILELIDNSANQLETVVSPGPDMPEAVSKIIPDNHRRPGRPRLTVPRQLVMPVDKKGSLRFRAGLLGISAATLLRREREMENEATD
jgi:hypothetical protein